MSLSEKVESAYVALSGNRVVIGAELLMGGVVYLSGISYNTNVDLTKGLTFCSAVILGYVACSCLSLTVCGMSTWKHYKRTIKEHKENGGVSQNFFKERILRSENRGFVGYCQLQGLYLGAKSTGHLEEFYSAKRKVSNCKIPNF